MGEVRSLAPEERDADNYQSIMALVKDNERNHQELRTRVMQHVRWNLSHKDGDRQMAIELLHAYNAMPKMG